MRRREAHRRPQPHPRRAPNSAVRLLPRPSLYLLAFRLNPVQSIPTQLIRQSSVRLSVCRLLRFNSERRSGSRYLTRPPRSKRSLESFSLRIRGSRFGILSERVTQSRRFADRAVIVLETPTPVNSADLSQSPLDPASLSGWSSFPNRINRSTKAPNPIAAPTSNPTGAVSNLRSIQKPATQAIKIAPTASKTP